MHNAILMRIMQRLRRLQRELSGMPAIINREQRGTGRPQRFGGDAHLRRRRCRLHQRQGCINRQRRQRFLLLTQLANRLLHRAAFHQLHAVIMYAPFATHAKHRHNMWVMQLRCRLRFVLKPCDI